MLRSLSEQPFLRNPLSHQLTLEAGQFASLSLSHCFFPDLLAASDPLGAARPITNESGKRRLCLATLPAMPFTLPGTQPVIIVSLPRQRKNYGPVRYLERYEHANRLLAAAAARPLTLTQACRSIKILHGNVRHILRQLVSDGKVRPPVRYQPLDIIDPSPYDLDLLRRGLHWGRVGDLHIGDYIAVRRPPNIERPVVLDLVKELAGERFLIHGDCLYYGTGTAVYLEIIDYLRTNPGVQHGWGELRTLCRQRCWTREAYESAQDTLRRGLGDAFMCPRFIPVGAEVAALFGYWVAEGWVTPTAAGWASHAKEASYRTEIGDALESMLGRRGASYFAQDTNGCSHVIGCKPLAWLLPRLFGSSARTKHLPDWWIDLPKDVLRAFLRALFNGDGCCFQTGPRRRISLKTASPELAWQVRLILLKLGVNAAIIEQKPQTARLKTGKPIRSGTAYSVNINGSAATLLAEWLGYSFPGVHDGNTGTCWFMDDEFLYLRVNSLE